MLVERMVWWFCGGGLVRGGFFFYLFDCFVLVLFLSLPHSLSECYYGRYSLVTSIPWGYLVVFLL